MDFQKSPHKHPRLSSFLPNLGVFLAELHKAEDHDGDDDCNRNAVLGRDQELYSKIMLITIPWLSETSQQKTRQLLRKWGWSSRTALLVPF